MLQGHRLLNGHGKHGVTCVLTGCWRAYGHSWRFMVSCIVLVTTSVIALVKTSILMLALVFVAVSGRIAVTFEVDGVDKARLSRQ